MSQPRKIKIIILTGSIAAITVTGAWYGAGLKTEHQKKQIVNNEREVSSADQIALLEQSRSRLIAKKIGLEKKIAELEERQRVAGKIDGFSGRER